MSTASVDPELCRIIRRGAELVPRVRELIEESKRPAEASGALAVDIGSVASQFLAMRKQLWQRTRDPLAAEVEQLLNFHQQILEQASILAFRPRTEHWAELAERFGDLDGELSRRLLELAATC
ncbi:MAG TPA: hypothetical protein VFU35_07745 [Jatrophihabitans sp.]|nr:hypothetical protein [Jatrophihabitans sp.]